MAFKFELNAAAITRMAGRILEGNKGMTSSSALAERDDAHIKHVGVWDG